MAGSALVTSEDYTVMSTPESVGAIPFGNTKSVHESPLHSGMPHPLIETEQLSLHYGEKPVFADVTLPIHAGCITALVGPSGCGKTSFLSCLNRLTDLIPRCRVSGRIRMGLLDVLDAKIDANCASLRQRQGRTQQRFAIALRRRVGLIFEKPTPLQLSIWKNLALPLREHGIRNREQVDQIIETTLQDVGLWNEVKDRL